MSGAKTQRGTFVCVRCQKDCSGPCAEVYEDDIPPLWSGFDMWAQCSCCKSLVALLEVVETEARPK